MIKRFWTALITSAAFVGMACAAEEVKPVKEAAPVKTVTVDARPVQAPDSAWRDLDPENTLYIETDYGRIVVELFPEIAPRHVAQIKTLVRQKFYDFITFHRVIDGFMNQTGDPKGDGTGDSSLPDIEAEFTFRRDTESMPFTLVTERSVDPQNPNSARIGAGFYKGLPVASQPSSQAILTKDGKVSAYGLHCKGVTSMARSQNPNSGNSQFFLMRGTSPWLDSQYSIWGNTVWGREYLTKFKVGTAGEDAGFVPDKMTSVRVVADLPAEEQLAIQVLRTDSSAFKTYLKTQKKADGTYPDICDIDVPSRLKK